MLYDNIVTLFFIRFIDEYRKYRSPIVFGFEEMRVFGEVMIRVVLHDKPTITIYQSVLKDQIRYLGQIGQRIWGAGENDVVFLHAALHISEYIHLHHSDHIQFEVCSCLFDKIGTLGKYLYRSDVRTAS